MYWTSSLWNVRISFFKHFLVYSFRKIFQKFVCESYRVYDHSFFIYLVHSLVYFKQKWISSDYWLELYAGLQLTLNSFIESYKTNIIVIILLSNWRHKNTPLRFYIEIVGYYHLMVIWLEDTDCFSFICIHVNESEIEKLKEKINTFFEIFLINRITQMTYSRLHNINHINDCLIS